MTSSCFYTYCVVSDKYVVQEHVAQLVHAFVLSILKTLLTTATQFSTVGSTNGSHHTASTPLERIAVRLIPDLGYNDHVAPALRQLH